MNDIAATALAGVVLAIVVWLVMRAQLVAERADARAKIATLEAQLAERERAEKFLQSAREEMANQFKVLASQLLHDESANFLTTNQQSLGQLLAPLQIDLKGFRERVEQVHLDDSKDRAMLRQLMGDIERATGTLHADTASLTNALKGDSKVQGDWGEMVLDRVLEAAGLREGVHYTRQASHANEDGARLRPDVVVHLPGERHVVIDSKVSLTAYADLVGAEDAAARSAALARHVASVRAHIQELSAKHYQDLFAGKSLDYVMMFIPNDGAFMQALQGDPSLSLDASKLNVALMCPNTLLVTLKTVDLIWRQDEQSRNWRDIAERGGKLHDKFVSFADDLLEVGTQLDKARASFDQATAKLSTGPGNLVRQVDMLAKLGVRGKKAIPKELLAETGDDEDAGGEMDGAS